MNVVKSIFIIAYIMMLVAITAVGARAYTADLNVGWLGVLIAAAPMAAFFMYIMMAKATARTKANLPVLLFLTIIGFGLTTYKLINNGYPVDAFWMATACLVGFLLYDFWYSRLDRSRTTVAVGETLPAFTLEDNGGQAVTADSFTGKPTILLFYRGNWCPLCMAQVKEIAGQYRDLAALGAEVVLVSPQSHAHTKSLAKKFDVPLRFLVDKDLAAAKTLGIDMDHGVPMGMQAMGYASDTVMPTVIITDRAGKVVFLDQTDNYRVRPEPATFLEVLRKLPAAT